MEAFDFDNAVSSSTSSSPSPEKSLAGFLMFTHHFKSITKLFRIVEIFLGLAFLSWTSSYLPFAVKISGEYLRQLFTIIIGPLFNFLLGNLIVVTLLLKAGHVLSGGRSSSTHISSDAETETDLYEEFIKTSDSSTEFTSLVPALVPDAIEYEDKQTIFEQSSSSVNNIESSDDALVPEKMPSEMKMYSRALSENLEAKMQSLEAEEILKSGKLRRWETMKCRKVANPGEIPADTVYVFDELSNEEFQQTIEAFIARQINFHREEKLAIVSAS
ncbi:OLC1v1010910C1 [Oldenlandia corymbosa var. corymbosa]|uniref:OLC1v1010910C1 n=1 Tax=Oldenlandia corymbosa var. corymbosa TaxID=529605 RepID=A0AAV1DUV2_OLDCO|nr:OLC1v1010910C1 [Oldenlandia corymbosa var. corymbosa]